MTWMQLFFLANAGVTIFAGIMMVTARKLIHAALWLVLTLFGVAAVFGFLEASFLVIVQVVVYIGAIAILIIFAVMLTHDAVDNTYKNSRKWILTGLIALLALGGILIPLLTWPQVWALTSPMTPEQLSIERIGLALVDPQGYVIPFEVASVLLLAALIGAIYVAIERKGEKS